MLYLFNVRRLIKIPLSANGHSSRIKQVLSRIFRKPHVYLSRGSNDIFFVGTLVAFVMDNLYMVLQIENLVY